MTLPAGVSTATVTFGKAMSFLGNDAAIRGTVSADRSIVHAATGWSLHSADDVVVAAEAGEATFVVPHVNQAGFLDYASGQAVTGWTYTFAGTIQFANGSSRPFAKTFQVNVGQSTLDLDLTGTSPLVPGVSFPYSRIQIGTVTTGEPGALAAAAVTGDGLAQTLNLTLPRGATGPQGAQGTPGTGTINLPPLVTNWVVNPSFEVDLQGWQVEANATIARSTTEAYSGAASMVVTQTTTGGGASAYQAVHGLTVGRVYTASVYVKRVAGNQAFAIACSGSYDIAAQNATRFSANAVNWTRLTLTFTATDTYIALYLYNADPAAPAGAGAVNSSHRVDAVTVAEGANAVPYFDGSTAGCAWLGTPHASASVQYLMPAESVVRAERLPELARNYSCDPTPTVAARWALTGGAALGTYQGEGAVALNRAGGATVIAQHHGAWAPCAPGETAVVSALVDVPAGMTVRLQVVYMNATGGTLAGYGGTAHIAGPFAGRVATPSSGPAAPGSTGRVTYRTYADSAGDGIAYLTRFMLTKGPAAQPAYFAGNSRGARWEGQPGTDGASSVKYAPDPTDDAMLTWLDAGRARGVGSPEGVVVAPPGASYTDTVATNGAVKWTKATGTGATGWVVEFGDTGWRTIAAWDAAGAFTVGSLTAPWVPYPGQSGVVSVRRVGNTVHVRYGNVSVSANPGLGVSMTAIPSGFDESVSTYYVVHMLRSGQITLAPMVRLGRSQSYSFQSGDSLYGSVSWLTNQAWPTTLPGVAA